MVVKHADLYHRGCQFDSSMRHNKNAIAEEGKKVPHEFHFPRKNSEPCLCCLLRSKLSMQRSLIGKLAKVVSKMRLQCVFWND